MREVFEHEIQRMNMNSNVLKIQKSFTDQRNKKHFQIIEAMLIEYFVLVADIQRFLLRPCLLR